MLGFNELEHLLNLLERLRQEIPDARTWNAPLVEATDEVIDWVKSELQLM